MKRTIPQTAKIHTSKTGRRYVRKGKAWKLVSKPVKRQRRKRRA